MTDYKQIKNRGYECRVDNVMKAMYIKKLSETTYVEATYSKDRNYWILMLFVQDNPGSKNAPIFSGVYRSKADGLDAVTDEMKQWLSAHLPHLVRTFTSL
jgi:hypothetical protein